MKIGTKLYAIVALMTLLVVAVAGIGFYAATISHDALYRVYKYRLEALDQLKYVSDMYAINIVDITHKVRDGAVSYQDASKNITKAQKNIDIKWNGYLEAYYFTLEEQRLVDETFPLLQTADKAIERLKAILIREDQEELKRFAAEELYPAVDPLTRKFAILVNLQLRAAKKEFEKSECYYA